MTPPIRRSAERVFARLAEKAIRYYADEEGRMMAGNRGGPECEAYFFPENFSVCPSYVPVVTDQAPQTIRTGGTSTSRAYVDRFGSCCLRSQRVQKTTSTRRRPGVPSARTRDSRSTAARSPSSTEASASSCSMLIT